MESNLTWFQRSSKCVKFQLRVAPHNLSWIVFVSLFSYNGYIPTVGILLQEAFDRLRVGKCPSNPKDQYEGHICGLHGPFRLNFDYCQSGIGFSNGCYLWPLPRLSEPKVLYRNHRAAKIEGQLGILGFQGNFVFKIYTLHSESVEIIPGGRPIFFQSKIAWRIKKLIQNSLLSNLPSTITFKKLLSAPKISSFVLLKCIKPWTF